MGKKSLLKKSSVLRQHLEQVLVNARQPPRQEPALRLQQDAANHHPDTITEDTLLLLVAHEVLLHGDDLALLHLVSIEEIVVARCPVERVLRRHLPGEEIRLL